MLCKYSSYSNNSLTKMLHWAVITSRIVLVYSFYGEQCVSGSWAGYNFFPPVGNLVLKKVEIVRCFETCSSAKKSSLLND